MREGKAGTTAGFLRNLLNKMDLEPIAELPDHRRICKSMSSQCPGALGGKLRMFSVPISPVRLCFDIL